MKKSKKEITPDFFSNKKKGVDIKGNLVVGITHSFCHIGDYCL